MAAASPSKRLVPTIMSGHAVAPAILQNRLQPVDVSCQRHLLSDAVCAVPKRHEGIAVVEERGQRVPERALGRRFTNGDAIDTFSQPLADAAGIDGDCRHTERTGLE